MKDDMNDEFKKWMFRGAGREKLKQFHAMVERLFPHWEELQLKYGDWLVALAWEAWCEAIRKSETKKGRKSHGHGKQKR